MQKQAKQKIVIIGKGAFGELMAKHLRPFFSISFIRRSTTDTQTASQLQNAAYVIYSVPFTGLVDSIMRTKSHISKETVIIDVTSVKVQPLRVLARHFKHNQILGTHPIFGPQSVKRNKSTLTGLPLVVCNQSCTPATYKSIKKFCKTTLGCTIIEQTSIEHDTQMAYVQGLSHFIGRALKQMDIQDYTTSTSSYHQLVELKNLLAGDSWDLFETIQNTNPEAQRVRKKLMRELQKIEKKLDK